MLSKLFREPITYFALLGAIIYAVYVPEVSEEDLTAATIELPSGFVAEQRSKFEKQYRRAPSDKELNGLLEQAINDEILFREAWRLQLFVGDEVVRKRMIQKMRFVLEEVGQPPEIDDARIEERLVLLENDTQQSTRFSLYHVAFGNYEAAKAYIEKIALDPSSREVNPDGVIAFPLGNAFGKISLKESERLFGRDFAEDLDFEQASYWQGPIKSRYGFHVVKLDDVERAEFKDDANARESIRQDIIREHRQEKRKEAIENIKTRYIVAYTE